MTAGRLREAPARQLHAQAEGYRLVLDCPIGKRKPFQLPGIMVPVPLIGLYKPVGLWKSEDTPKIIVPRSCTPLGTPAGPS